MTSSGGVDTLDTSGNGGTDGLTTDDFMNMFLAQLQNQDPTQPMDDSTMLTQLSQMSMLQTFQDLEKSLSGTQLAESSALIGKNVTGMDVNGQPVDGVVSSVTQSTDAGLVLQVGSQYITPGERHRRDRCQLHHQFDYQLHDQLRNLAGGPAQPDQAKGR